MRWIGEFVHDLRIPWLFAVGVAVCVALVAVWFGGLNQDEGWYLYSAQMVHAGKLPYRDFFFTQGPALPFVYSVLSGVWAPESPFSGLLGGRIVTLLFGTLGTFVAMGLVRRLVPIACRGMAGLAVFALLACNLYHVYFTTIPKTYALGGLFVLSGFLLIAVGLKSAFGLRRTLCLVAAGLSLAFATGTRISLLLILPVVGLVMLFNFRSFRWSFLWFGLGGVVGLALTYGLFALDPVSLKALLAAQRYHAARGGFDPFFALGSVSRLARGYAALGIVLFAVMVKFLKGKRLMEVADGDSRPVTALMWMLGLSFAAVFLLQLSAPFPYDDYQVPLMGLLVVLLGALFSRLGGMVHFVVLTACLVSFTSPLLQEWATYNQDRFWSQKKEMTELAKLREVGREINTLDPNGKTLLTQDLYLAVETGRTVPQGLEMGPFSFFPEMSTDEARAVHVLNRELLEKLLLSAPCPIAACSGYAFAISVPKCVETPFDDQKRYFELLRQNYDLVSSEPKFGQNATTLLLMKKKGGMK